VSSRKPCSQLTLIRAISHIGTPQSGPAETAIAPQGLLGAICYGAQSLLDSQRSALPVRDCAVQYVATPPLGAEASGGQSCLWQLIYTDRSVQSGHARRIHFCTDGVFLFGVLELPRVRGRSGDLMRSAQGAYEEIFSFLSTLDSQRPFKLWRVWNYIPDIHGEDNDLERYRQFNIGRLRAFTEHWAARSSICHSLCEPTREIPASCGVGMIGPSPAVGLTVAFLASHLSFIQIENPRQISAYHYPIDYGPSSPTFSRAVLGPADCLSGGSRPYFIISGTASIIGHRTMHGGDVAEQGRESLRNIEALVQEANKSFSALGQKVVTMSELQYLVYLRQPRDLPTVEAVLSEVLGTTVNVRVVHADICRNDLLIEIEASMLSTEVSA
jgi:chorismate lyase/3-hydroxybenzoate synthase